MLEPLRARLCHCTLWLSRAVQEKNCLRARKLGPLELLEANIKIYKDERSKSCNAFRCEENRPVTASSATAAYRGTTGSILSPERSSGRKNCCIKSYQITISHNYIVTTISGTDPWGGGFCLLMAQILSHSIMLVALQRLQSKSLKFIKLPCESEMLWA